MFHLTIITSEKILLEEEVFSLLLPGTEGYLQILRDHAPLITALQAGRLIAVDSKRERQVHAISGGFLKVDHNRVVVLADTIERVTEIDFKRAEAAYWRAIQAIEAKDRDIEEALQALTRAENRIKTYKEFIAYTQG